MIRIEMAALIGAFVFGAQCASASCLNEAEDFAERICGEISRRGSSQMITASGKLTVEAQGLLQETLGSIGGEFAGEAEKKTFENVLQEQLGPELVNVRQCRTRMAEAAIKQVCERPAPSCRHPDFGQAGWARQETLHGTSGWRSGGYNQDAYCTDFIASVVQARQLGGKPYSLEKTGSSEEARWTGPLRRHRQYNYHCSVKLSWEPIYNERKDPRCAPPIRD
jgi:hypothetical protein